MQASLDFESERETTETAHQSFYWPNALLSGHVVTKSNKFGFEVILPGYPHRSLEVESPHQPMTFSPHLSSVHQGELQGDEGSDSQVDFEGIDRLFNSLGRFNGKLTMRKGLGFEEASLVKRPPRYKGRLRNDADSEDTSTVYSSYSRPFEGKSESHEGGFNKTGHQKKQSEIANQAKGKYPPTRIVLPLPPSEKAPLSRSDRHQRVMERERNLRTLPKEDDDQRAASDHTFTEVLRAMVFHDDVNSDAIKKLSDLDRELVLKIIRLRYKGAELLKFPFKTKKFASYNTKSHLRLFNERKLLGEMWPLLIDQLKKMRNVFRSDKDEETVDLFRVYHKKYFEEKIRQKLDEATLKELDDDNDALLVNLFAELYLSSRP